MPVLFITPKDVFENLSNTSKKIVTFLKTLKEPQINSFVKFVPQTTRKEIKKELHSHTEWYQDIEFGKRLITYTHSHRKFGKRLHFIKELFSIRGIKNRAVFSAMPNMTGRTVLEIGCNSGLYSCYASMKGADSVLGIDMDPKRITQAKIVHRIFQKQGRVRNKLEFRQANIQMSLDLFDGFDTLFACCLLYPIGDVSLLKKRIKESQISLILIQCNTVRGELIGKKNRINVPGYESGVKTWGKILGTVKGVEQFLLDCGFAIEKVANTRSQFPVLIGSREIT